MTEPIIFYHAGCMDGFAAACVVARHLDGEGDYRPVQYGAPVPDDIDGRDVYVVDFSWPLAEMREIRRRSRTLVWCDHHETSAVTAKAIFADPSRCATDVIAHNQRVCGAVLTWGTLRGAEDMPESLSYVQDRDLWRWALPASREVSAGLAATWRPRFAHPTGPGLDDYSEAYTDFLAYGSGYYTDIGATLLAEQRERVRTACRRAVSVPLADVDGDPVRALAVNSAIDQSEIGEALCLEHGADVGVVWFHDPAAALHYVHSLRSRRPEVNVATIAKGYGGGGHPQAAGFTHRKPIVEW